MSVYIDIDIDEIISVMSTREKQELVDELYEDGFIPKELERNFRGEFGEALEKLSGNDWRLSKEDEQRIINIANKL